MRLHLPPRPSTSPRKRAKGTLHAIRGGGGGRRGSGQELRGGGGGLSSEKSFALKSKARKEREREREKLRVPPIGSAASTHLPAISTPSTFHRYQNSPCSRLDAEAEARRERFFRGGGGAMRKKNEISLSWGKKNRVKRLASSFSVFLGGLETSSPPLERRKPRRREKRSRLQAGPPLTSTGGGDEGTHAVWFFFSPQSASTSSSLFQN